MSQITLRNRNRASIVLCLGLIIALDGMVQIFAQNASPAFGQTETKYQATAFGANDSLAETEAFKKLALAIAAKIAPDYSSQQIKMQQEEWAESVARVIETFAKEIKPQLSVLREPADTGISITYFLSASALQNILEKRKKFICDIFKTAEVYEKERNVQDALKFYYFCIILANSLPAGTVDCGGLTLTAELPARITKILANLSFTVREDYAELDGRRKIILEAHVGNLAVTTVEICCLNCTPPLCIEGKDGMATLQLPAANAALREIEIGIKFSYDESRDEIPAVGQLWDLVNRPDFANRRRITLSGRPALPQPDFRLTLTDSGNCTVRNVITRETQNFLQALKAPDKIPATVAGKDQFLLEKIQLLFRHNTPSLRERDIKAQINKTATGWEVRRIPVLNRYPTINKQSTEYLILDFSPEGKLIDINFSLNDNLYREFVEEGNAMRDWRERQVIIKFIEKYRTAYLNRDINTINTIFADNAVIIIGRVLQSSASARRYAYEQKAPNQPDIEYLRLSKIEYLKRLTEVFKNQKDIFLGFSSFKINLPPNRRGIYGISMRQNYSSTTYADIGYLFLLIDFKLENPQIYIRAWQPNEWDRDNLIRLTNYRIIGE